MSLKISPLNKKILCLALTVFTTPVMSNDIVKSHVLVPRMERAVGLNPMIFTEVNALRTTKAILSASVFSKNSVSFEDLGDQYLVVKNLQPGQTADIKLDLQLLFSTGAGTGKKMTIGTEGISGIAPDCSEIRAGLSLSGKLDCYGTFEGRRTLIGSAGNSAESCVTISRPVYKTEQICAGSPPICEKNWRPFCDDRYTIECEDRVTLVRTDYDKECTATSYTANFQVTSFQSEGDSRINSQLIFEGLNTSVQKTKNGNTLSNTTTTSLQGQRRDIGSAFSFGLYCDDGRAVGQLFNGHGSYSFSYEDIYSTCGDQAVRLKSNRPIHFNVGQLVFTFDN